MKCKKKGSIFLVCFFLLLMTIFAVSSAKGSERKAGLVITVPPTGEIVSYSSVNYDMKPFSYSLKESYSSYAEVIAEKKALKEYSEQYEQDLLDFLVPIEAVDGYETAYDLEMKSGYYTTRLQVEEELRNWEHKFRPTKEELIRAQEELLKDYVDLVNQTIDEQKSEHGMTAMAVLREYQAGEISIDEALENSGTIHFLNELYRLESDHSSYNEHLSRFNLLYCFCLNDYNKDN